MKLTDTQFTQLTAAMRAAGVQRDTPDSACAALESDAEDELSDLLAALPGEGQPLLNDQTDIMHWSSPAGCHDDCPACARELDPDQQDELLMAFKDAHWDPCDQSGQIDKLRAALQLCIDRLSEYPDAAGGIALEGARRLLEGAI